MSKKILETLLGSRARVKILKLLFRNNDRGFDLKEMAARVQESPRIVRKETKKLLTIGLLKSNHDNQK